MRLSLLSSASALALAAMIGQAHADADMTGVLALYGGAGSVSEDNFGGADDPTFYGVKGQGYWPLSPSIHLQIDLFAEQTDNELDSWRSDDSTAYGGTMHWVHPYNDHFRVGLAGSIWYNEDFDITNSSGQVGVTYGLAALEAQYSGRDWSLTGQAGYFDEFSCGNCFLALTTGEYVRGKARYYFSENTALTAEAMQLWGSYDDLFFTNKSLHSTTLGLQAEHKFEASPYAGFLGVTWERDAIDKYGSTSSVQTTAVTLGFKFYLDQPSIQSNERTGAAFDTPTFGSAPELSGFLKF
jgi:hypothetical protein